MLTSAADIPRTKSTLWPWRIRFIDFIEGGNLNDDADDIVMTNGYCLGNMSRDYGIMKNVPFADL